MNMALVSIDRLGAAIFARAFIGIENNEKDYLAESIEGREFSKKLLQFMTYNRYKYDRGWLNDCNAAQIFQDAGATYAELIAMAPLFLRTRIFNELTAYIDMTQGATLGKHSAGAGLHLSHAPAPTSAESGPSLEIHQE